MSEAYISELRLLPYNFAPKFWAACNGQMLPINQNQALFALLGTTYGGDGITTFALPNLQGRVPMGQSVFSGGHTLGEVGGEAAHTLTQTELPQHVHFATATTDSASPAVAPSGTLLGGAVPTMYAPTGTGSLVALAPATVGSVGGSQAHSNMQPYTVLQWCICIAGLFPSRN
ncbi:MAG: tail fiber protein [Patulibacter minatonensis]